MYEVRKLFFFDEPDRGMSTIARMGCCLLMIDDDDGVADRNDAWYHSCRH